MKTSSKPQIEEKAELLHYNVFLTSTGQWMHAPSSNFLFAYIDNSWSAADKTAVAQAFKDALQMSTKIKNAVKATSGQDVVNGLYLLDQPAMTKAMNSIDGMGMTSAVKSHQAGSSTAVGITQEFFNSVLGGLGGDVAPMLKYLTTQMGDIQVEVKKNTSSKTFGIVIGLISLMPGLGIPITSFQYVYSSQATSSWFTKILCSSAEKHTYQYEYVVTNYNYNTPGALKLMANPTKNIEVHYPHGVRAVLPLG